MMRKSILQITQILCILLVLGISSCSKTATGTEVTPTPKPEPKPPAQDQTGHQGSQFNIPLAGNAFVTSPSSGFTETIADPAGLKNWTSSNTVISTYVKFPKAGKIRISVLAKAVAEGENNSVELRIGDQKKSFNINSATQKEYMIGDFNVTAGYVKIDLQGIRASNLYYGELSDMVISGEATLGGLTFANKTDFYYWARRGPSCHLSYTVPTSENVSYYYSEINVPVGQDPVGSYFMANGFGEGYFGFQVNSTSERRILFSVWSPFNTDNPNNIPEDQKIKLNRKGPDVFTGEFGNEGSGGQSYLKYTWKAGTTYRFLLKGEPDGTGKTDYTAWFYKTETSEWVLIASFKRPATSTYLKGFHGFLENFSPNMGHFGRTANYMNQWVRTTAGTWMKVSEAKFTVDNTYNQKQRIDAFGGSNATGFFLKNGGFFNDYVAPNTKFTFNNSQSAPSIDLTKLP
ncbi:DUF3472 domain-containing protein [Sphingobacterium lactis]|uniref:DUF3472 domain-containing protein n=1 Tax=Sphingobacterium lactis TaxID=797291 RepID=UPI003F81748D